VTPDLQLPCKLQSATSPWLAPNYTARHTGVNNLPRIVTWSWKWSDLESKPQTS